MRRYSTIPKTKGPEGNLMYKTVRYPEIPRRFSDTYIFTTDTDRYDILALQYYGDSDLWWIISIANETLTKNGLFIPEGTQLRIPFMISDILSSYKVYLPNSLVIVVITLSS